MEKPIVKAPIKTPRTLAEILKAQGVTVPLAQFIAKRDDPEHFPLSYQQQQLWFLDQFLTERSLYNLAWAVRLHGTLHVPALEAAIQELVRRHEVLRTSISDVQGRPALAICQPPAVLEIVDLQGEGKDQQEKDLAHFIREQLRLPFDLSRPPLLRAALLRISDVEHVLLVVIHHIASDGWSIGVLARELGILYNAFLRGEGSPLGEPQIQYADYAAWQRNYLRGEALESLVRYWKGQLEGAPTVLEFPMARPRSGLLTYTGAQYRFTVPKETFNGLEKLSRHEGATLFMTLMAGFQVLLHRYTGHSDMLIGSPSAGRTRKETEGLIGFFVNMLVMRARLTGNPSVRELLRQVREMALDAFANQDVPFEKLMEELQPEREVNRSPLFQVVFALHDHNPHVKMQGLAAHELELTPENEKFDLTFTLKPDGDKLEGVAAYRTELFDEETIGRMVKHYLKLLHDMVRRPDARIGELQLLPAEEREQILAVWNATDAEFPSGTCVHELFEEQARVTPDAIAVIQDDAALTYGELDRRANQLAHYLLRLGIGAEVPVGICMERSPEMAVSILGILKAGAAYIPIDPASPVDHKDYVLRDAHVSVLLTQGKLLRSSAAKQIICVDEEFGRMVQEREENPEVRNYPENLAYLIYTSGSTGRPKGTCITHRNAVNLMTWMQREFPLGPAEKLLQKTALTFDTAFWEFFHPWMNGESVVMLPAAAGGSASVLNAIHRNGATRLQFIPSALDALTKLEEFEKHTESLSHVFAGGEALTGDIAKRFLAHSEANLYNIYGPTETTVMSTFYRINRQSLGVNVPIGRPILNTKLYVLDQHGEPAPVGALGELYIGGEGVARGYLNRPELTAERFLPDPFAGKAARMYRTGDLVRWLSNGTVEFVGRSDFQVKVRGFRIEPQEIEARLTAHPSISAAVVMVRNDVQEDRRLTAYYTASEKVEERSGLQGISVGELRAYLSSQLPDYMVPSAYVLLESFPLMTNGKLDRKALPAPNRDACAIEEYEPPLGEIEVTLAKIWTDLLHVEQVGRHDNFFDLGGHSLLAIQVISRSREVFRREISLRKIFEYPTIAGLSAALESQTGVETSFSALVTRKREPEEKLPLSFAQQRLWFLAQMEGVSEAYHIAIGLRLIGRLDGGALRRALDRIVWRHEALRTNFVWEKEEPVQRIRGKEESSFLLLEQDLRQRGDREVEVERLAALEAGNRFDLAEGPLIRGRLVQVGEEEHVLLITMHHIVSDGWSMGVMIRELKELYRAYVHGEEDPLPGLWVQYGDYAVWQREWMEGEIPRQQTEYWKKRLAGAPELLELPWEHGRPAEQDYAGGFVEVELEEELTRGLRKLSQGHGTTMHMTLLAGWGALLGRLSGQEEVVIGTPVANRGRGEIEKLIGFFVNTVALRVDLRGRPRVRELLRRVKEEAIGGQQNQEIPFERVVEVVQPERSLSHSPVYQVMFAWQNRWQEELELEGLKIVVEPRQEHQVAKYDLTLTLREEGGRIVGGVEYARGLFERGTIERYVGYMKRVLEGMVEGEEEEVGGLRLVGEEERRQVLYEWNETKVEYAKERSVHELFEEQVRRTPEAVAVVYEDVEVSYGELNRRANQLAHYLRREGVGPEVKVGICTERSLEMVVGLLGILKAGGGYVPLDPSYPEERLRYMVKDSEPRVVLVQGEETKWIREELRERVRVVELSEGEEWRDQPERNPERGEDGVSGEHLAYVIYTSGSTGTPKGVMVQHGALTNFLRSMQEELGMGSGDVLLAITRLSFDIAALELYLPLTLGAQVRILSQEACMDGARLKKELENKVTMMQATPAGWQILLHAGWQRTAGLKALCGGETLSADLAGRLASRSETVWNMYGPTETTVWSLRAKLERLGNRVSIGRPIANTRVYVLDGGQEPVPVGVVGELYIGGEGLARGYCGRGDLTGERFVPDSLSGKSGERLYRTGDLVRWLVDGNIEYMGRMDYQVKIRGFRIELGEIEARLLEHESVGEAVVVARGEGEEEKRLIAYYSRREGEEVSAEELRRELMEKLPEYMVPAAYVELERMPLTGNGKLDRKALPEPEGEGYGVSGYEEPEGEIERQVAEIWGEVLKVERVGRQDNFFALGGHSLLAVRLIERMRGRGMGVDVRSLFATPTVASLAASMVKEERGKEVEVPENRIPAGCRAIRPEMLTLVELSEEEIGRIVGGVEGGAENVQDIYPLTPLQEGILFHHVLGGEGDPYLLGVQLSFESREQLDRYVKAMQGVMERHDILRTGVMWEGLREPVQVVWRKAGMRVEEVEVEAEEGKGGDVGGALYERYNPRGHRIDVREAPLLRAYVAEDREKKRWVMMQLLHHLAGDHTTLEVLQEEIGAYLLGEEKRLPVALPFRNLVAQTRLGIGREEHEAYFGKLLGDVEETTAPFGLVDVQGDGGGIREERVKLKREVAVGLRKRARELGVSVASLFHVGWAQVLGRVSGREDVVFGTVLFGRMQGGAGADRVMGLFINTLPVRVGLGEKGVEASVREMQGQLSELMRHEHASLSLAQRCSGVAVPGPLFSALLNYRHSSVGRIKGAEGWKGIEVKYGEERTNYPVVLTVDDLGEDFVVTAQVQGEIEPQRVCGYMARVLESLVKALEGDPAAEVGRLEVLGEEERRQVLYEWNETKVEYAEERSVHELFEEQVRRTPEAVAVVYEDVEVSYGELNRRANQLAHYLRELGVKAETRVGMAVERGVEMVVGLLGILKAGGGYVPLDPSYPEERLRYMVKDSEPRVVLVQGEETKWIREELRERVRVVELSEGEEWRDQPERNPERGEDGVSGEHLAYVIYTSGSTGTPKGVMIEHRNAVNLICWAQQAFARDVLARTLFSTSLNFDLAVYECFVPLTVGAAVRIVPNAITLARTQGDVTLINTVPSVMKALMEAHEVPRTVRVVNLAGEPLRRSLVERIFATTEVETVCNLYGPSETTTYSTWMAMKRGEAFAAHIGKPIANTRVYILDGGQEPVPVGVVGELYIGGAGVARGYLNQEELTAKRFVKDTFVEEAGARMYRTGDLGRWLEDGTIEFLGRNDYQVKIRGFRIELGEIEARLLEHESVGEAVVVARGEGEGEKRLIAYYSRREGEEVSAEELRRELMEKLPEYMVPAAYVQLESFPLTGSGKLDRKALPVPEEDAYAVSSYEAPQGEMESQLAEIWAEVLKVERVGRHDNFFALGGDSLLAVQTISQIRQALKVEVSISDLFERPILASLGEQIIDAQLAQFDSNDLASIWKSM